MISVIYELQHPVERGVAATQDGELLASELIWITYPIMQRGVCEIVGIRQPEWSRLKRAYAACDHKSIQCEFSLVSENTGQATAGQLQLGNLAGINNACAVFSGLIEKLVGNANRIDVAIHSSVDCRFKRPWCEVWRDRSEAFCSDRLHSISTAIEF